jgi:hypothetical protein
VRDGGAILDHFRGHLNQIAVGEKAQRLSGGHSAVRVLVVDAQIIRGRLRSEQRCPEVSRGLLVAEVKRERSRHLGQRGQIHELELFAVQVLVLLQNPGAHVRTAVGENHAVELGVDDEALFLVPLHSRGGALSSGCGRRNRRCRRGLRRLGHLRGLLRGYVLGALRRGLVGALV